ncbi:hypothetical protein [Janthinobacterium sp. PAMC25594]|uniref:hypothetical protein n=1 Tax=Janthinobacterium sp. PAMC25594 TaxID=2861284 RepID=UPI001C639DD7|nr:hypothetical protein [Janthinobacterium sp. PAMC25594]QYG09824.1 hypothetical protein KY494_14435 [Janthinobacterium sp. PAMC25594]
MATAAVQAVQAVSTGWLGAPWIIWSGLISAVVASGVAAFTTRASSKNSLRLLAMQHEHDNFEANRQREHDAKQKDEDRKATIRREVYAKAVEETHALLGYIGGLPDRPLNAGNDADGFQSFLKANAKIWLVADAEAAHLSRDLASDFAEVFFHEMTTSYPIRIAMEPIRRRREDIAFAEGEARRLVSQFTDAKARNASSEEQAKLGDLAVKAHEYVKALELAQQQAMGDTALMRMETFQATFGKLRPVQRAIVKLVSALREELNLPRDDDKFMEQLKDMERRAWTAVNSASGIDPPWPMPEIVEPD